MKNAAMCAHARHARFLVFQLVPMTLQEMPKVVREHRPFVEVRVLNSSTSEMTQATSVDVFFSLLGGLATEWHGDSLCQQRLAGSVIGWLGLWIPGFSNLIVFVVHGPGFDLYSLNNLTLLFSYTDHFESF